MKLLIFLALVALCSARSDRVKLDIYYEAFCPDTHAFIANQLQPLYNDFRDNLDIMFVPFGKSNSTAVGAVVTFNCQNGPEECFGNRVQGCVLSRIPDQDGQVDYVACQMNFGTDRTHRTCVEEFGFSWAEIEQCANGVVSERQQLGFEQITVPALLEFNWVPTVAYNGKIIEFSHTGRAPPLREIICGFINNSNSACNV